MAQSPTVNAGYEVLSELPKERHVAPMLSLDKTKDVEALSAFLGDKEGLLSWKMDGLTNVLTYRDGELQKAVTRGNGEIGEIYLAYTHFKNTVTHIPTLIKLLPVDTEGMAEAEVDDNVMMNFEPNTEEALDLVIPKYVTSLFYGALVESVASENGARMQAMDSATSNADEIISDLTLKFNRARQGAITQELTEIIAGANAIN